MARLPPKQKGLRVFRPTIMRRIGKHLSDSQMRKVRPTIQSDTLREAIRVKKKVETNGNGDTVYSYDLYIPHYWAVYYHDGRPGLRKRNRYQRGGYFCFFPNPDDDPRFRKNPPVRARDVRHLTKNEFKRFMQENRARKIRGQEPIMVVTPFVGPLPAHPFFQQLIADPGLFREAGDLFQQWAAARIPTDESVARAATPKFRPLR